MNGNFLGSWGHQLVPNPKVRTFVPVFSLNVARICLSDGLFSSTAKPSAVLPALLRQPTSHTHGSGILTGFPSTTPLGLALGTD